MNVVLYLDQMEFLGNSRNLTFIEVEFHLTSVLPCLEGVEVLLEYIRVFFVLMVLYKRLSCICVSLIIYPLSEIDDLLVSYLFNRGLFLQSAGYSFIFTFYPIYSSFLSTYIFKENCSLSNIRSIFICFFFYVGEEV